jgi:hypothetical protein
MKSKTLFDDDECNNYIKEQFYKSKFKLDLEKPIFEEEISSNPFDDIKLKRRVKK